MSHRKLAYWAILFGSLLLSSSAYGTTYYIAANGSDANAGTNKTAPWAHAPGMKACTATCASTTPQAGDQFIFRGGDTWHVNSGTPSTGGSWVWTWSGNSSSPIYIGVDKTWYSGASWARPIFTFDNPESTSPVSSCAHPTNTETLIDIGTSPNQGSGAVNYVTVDNFEQIGSCWGDSNTTSPQFSNRLGTYITIENVYIHGWTHSSCSVGYCDENYAFNGYNGLSGSAMLTHNALSYITMDGSDSPPNSGAFAYADCYDVDHSVIRYTSNGLVCINLTQVHDNLIEYVSESYDGGSHGNTVLANGNAPAPSFFYNNVIRHISNLGVANWLVSSGGQTPIYAYNNLFYDIRGSAGSNCFAIGGTNGQGSQSNSLYVYNNTFVSPCNVRFVVSGSFTPCWIGAATFSNNHFIGYGSPGTLPNAYSIDSGCSPTIAETTGDLFQSVATAASQGYVNSGTGYCANDTTPCAPTSSGDSTVGNGTNYTSLCPTFGTAFCSGTTVGVTEVSGSAVSLAEALHLRPSNGLAWDIGAYQFGGNAASQPAPPTGLIATVQ